MNNPKPKVSLLLAAYQQESVVEQAVKSALAQTYSPLQIIISDDSSTDGTFAAIKKTTKYYSGPHDLIVRRNTTNEGITAHFSRLATMADGELLFVAAGDDLSEKTRCEKVVQHWVAHNRKHDLIATDLSDMDAHGGLHGVIKHTQLDEMTLDDWIEKQPWLVGASHTWTRRLFEAFGPLKSGANSEDQIMLLRALLAGGATTLQEPLVSWRRGGLSRKKRHSSLGAMLDHIRMGNASTQAELEQIMADARTGKQFDKIHQALAKRVAKENFVSTMLKTSSLWTRLLTAVNTSAVPLSYRVRIFGYTSLPWLYAPLIRLKALTRLSTHKDAAGRPAE
jgi:glycosyltransferase involved in cell wall biosynthesis